MYFSVFITYLHDITNKNGENVTFTTRLQPSQIFKKKFSNALRQWLAIGGLYIYFWPVCFDSRNIKNK